MLVLLVGARLYKACGTEQNVGACMTCGEEQRLFLKNIHCDRNVKVNGMC